MSAGGGLGGGTDGARARGDGETRAYERSQGRVPPGATHDPVRPTAGRDTVPLNVGGGAAPPPAGPKSGAPDRTPPKPGVVARVVLSSVLPDPVRLEEGKVFRIGRDKTSDICFPSTHVSRHHAELVFEKGAWVVGDLGSRNGTQVNGERIFKRALKDGDKVQLGHFELLFRELDQAELSELRAKKRDTNADTLKLSQDDIGFFGDVKRLSVVEVVQLLGQNRKTGILSVVEEKAPERRLALVEGTIVHAEFGGIEGERAVLPILRTRAGKFAFRPTPEARERVSVETPTPTLLLQAMEASSQRPQG